MRADPSSVNQELFLNVPSLQTVLGSTPEQGRRSLGRLCLAGTWDMPRIVTVPTPAHCSPCREPLPMHRAVHTALAAPLTTPYPPNAHHAACRSFNRALGESMKGLEVV